MDSIFTWRFNIYRGAAPTCVTEADSAAARIPTVAFTGVCVFFLKGGAGRWKGWVCVGGWRLIISWMQGALERRQLPRFRLLQSDLRFTRVGKNILPDVYPPD